MATHEITIAKAKSKLSVDDMQFDDATLLNLIAVGITTCLNSRMTKVGAVTKLEGKELADAQAMAMRIAQENLEALASGKFKFPGTKAKSAEPAKVINEAIKQAREVVLDQIRAQGWTISHVPAKAITAAAKELVKADPSYIAKAKEILAEREKAPSGLIDLTALGLKPDPEKLAKAEAAKVKRKENLSAKQSGKVAGRTTKSKPKSADVADVLAGLTQKGSGSGSSAHH